MGRCRDALAWLEEQPTPTALDQQLRSSRRLLLRRLRRAAEAEAQKPPELRRDVLGMMAQGWLRRVAALAIEVGTKPPENGTQNGANQSPQPKWDKSNPLKKGQIKTSPKWDKSKPPKWDKLKCPQMG